MDETLNDLKLPPTPNSEPSSPTGPPPQPDMPDLDRCCRRKHDVALIYANEDGELALNIMEEMTKWTGLDVRLQTDEECFGPNVVARPGEIASKCWLVLVVHTRNTAKSTVTQFTKDELIGRILIEQSEDYIRPLRTEKGLSILQGLASIESLPWYSQPTIQRTKKQIEKIIEYRKEDDRTKKPNNLKHEAPVKYSDKKVKRNDNVYKMDGSHKGLMIIINNEEFADPKKYTNRASSRDDAESLQTLFHDVFGFKVETETNLTAGGIKGTFEKHLHIFEQGDYCCFAAAILSHGKNGGVLGTDGNLVTFEEIKNIFLDDRWILHTDKPKLLFIQACREGETVIELSKVTPGPLSRESHFYWAFATAPGYPAIREEDDGSYYIKCLVDVFRKYAHNYDLEELMTEVAYNVERKTSTLDIKKSGNVSRHSPQVPERRTTLLKKLYFLQ